MRDGPESADCIQDALAGLVADVADLQEAGLTPKDVMRQLDAWNVPEAVTVRVGRLLDGCDAARYAGAAASANLGDEAPPVLEAVIEALRAKEGSVDDRQNDT